MSHAPHISGTPFLRPSRLSISHGLRGLRQLVRNGLRQTLDLLLECRDEGVLALRQILFFCSILRRTASFFLCPWRSAEPSQTREKHCQANIYRGKGKVVRANVIVYSIVDRLPIAKQLRVWKAQAGIQKVRTSKSWSTASSAFSWSAASSAFSGCDFCTRASWPGECAVHVKIS